MPADLMKHFRFLNLFFAIIILAVLVQCKKDNQISGNVKNPSSETIQKDTVKKVEEIKPQITYSAFIFPTKKDLFSRFGLLFLIK